jgi:hypothetical protein
MKSSVCWHDGVSFFFFRVHSQEKGKEESRQNHHQPRSNVNQSSTHQPTSRTITHFQKASD